jgi:hypothetical protein
MTLTKVLHVRRLAQFERQTDDWLDEQIAEAQSLFSVQADIALVKDSDLVTPVNAGVVNVESCRMNGPSTAEQLALFAGVAAEIPPTEAVVFIIRDSSPWRGGGCAWHPAGQLGCMVVAGQQGEAQWKLAHELGHVFGLFHTAWSTRLMYPSVDWSVTPPNLSPQEVHFLHGEGALPQGVNPSLGLNDPDFKRELRKIEPNYQAIGRFGREAEGILRRVFLEWAEPEYRARALYALSLVSDDIDDILSDAAKSSDPFERRAAAEAAGRSGSPVVGSRILSVLASDPDPSVRYLAKKSIEARPIERRSPP